MTGKASQRRLGLRGVEGSGVENKLCRFLGRKATQTVKKQVWRPDSGVCLVCLEKKGGCVSGVEGMLVPSSASLACVIEIHFP